MEDRDRMYPGQKKILKKAFRRLSDMMGAQGAGMFIMICCDLMNKFTKGVDRRELRTLEIKLNDFFSAKYDFEHEQVID